MESLGGCWGICQVEFTNMICKISKNYFGNGYMYLQTNNSETIALQSVDYDTHYNLSNVYYFEVEFETNSDSQIDLILLKDGIINKTLILSQSGNTNFSQRTIQIFLNENAEFDQLKISGTLEDTDYVKVYDIKLKKDVSAPIVNINSPTPNELFGTSAPGFNVEIYDPNLDSMWYTLDNGLTNTTFTTNETINQALWDALPEGNIIIRFYANDSFSNVGFVEVTIRKDVSAPVITTNNPQNSDVIGAIAPNFDISIDELNLDKTWYSLNGGNNITFTGLTGTINQALWDALPEGNIIIRFYANDSSSDVGFVEVTIRKDVSAPVITINNPQNSDVIEATAPSFDISIDEPNLDKTWYSLNGGNNITFTGFTGTINQALWDALPEGNIIIKFYANDTLGRLEFQEVIVVKNVPQPTPPEIPGYNILFLLGIVSIVAVIIVKKRLNRLN